MERLQTALGRPLDFLKIWHNVFSKKLEYAVEYGEADSSLKPESICDDLACQTGQWLSSQTADVRSLENYRRLIEIHRDFHVVAAEVARVHQAGQLAKARALVAGIFSNASNGVCVAIDTLSQDLVKLGIYPERFPPPAEKRASIWDPSFVIGIAEVDRQHHAIATLIDQVLVNGDIECASIEGSGFLAVLGRLIKRDIDTENAQLLQMIDTHPDCAAHLEAHQSILDYLDKLHRAIDAQQIVSFGEVGRYLGNWYIDHLVSHDLDLEVNWRRRTIAA